MPKPPSSASKSKSPKKPATPTPPQAPAPDATAKLTRFASFAPDAVHRSLLKAAPYNPRRLTEDARRKLRANLERVGLLEPVIWNKRTGNVVGGHQRLKVLDALEGSPDYLVPVAVVDLDLATEKAQNIFLNNAEAQGEWDLLALGDLFKDIPQVELTGFDLGDLYSLFGCDPTQQNVAPHIAREEPPSPEPQPAPNPVSARDQEFDRREEEAKEREPGEHYRVIVFASNEAAEAFDREFHLSKGRYIDGKALSERLKGGATNG